MTIYEVRVEVDNEIASSYYSWLGPHVQEVVAKGEFTKGLIFTEEPPHAGVKVWTMHFISDDAERVRNYLENSAPELRKDAIQRFGDRFRAQRRILTFHSATHRLT